MFVVWCPCVFRGGGLCAFLGVNVRDAGILV